MELAMVKGARLLLKIITWPGCCPGHRCSMPGPFSGMRASTLTLLRFVCPAFCPATYNQPCNSHTCVRSPKLAASCYRTISRALLSLLFACSMAYSVGALLSEAMALSRTSGTTSFTAMRSMSFSFRC